MKYIIFDLDQTLVDTSLAEQERKNRNWPKVYSMIPSFTLYPGIREVMNHIQSKGLNVCIVTTSPGVYAKKVLQHFNIPYSHLIDYFSVAQRKPHPESFHKALTLLQCPCNATISFGDRAIDIVASNAANITSVACTWGTQEMDLLKRSNPTHIIDNPADILNFISAN